MRLRTLLTSAGIGSALGYLRGIHTRDLSLKRLTKPFPVLALAGRVALNRRDPYSNRVVAGLLSSALGDYYLDQGEDDFLKGVGAFFVAHLFYIAAYEKDSGPLALGRAVAVYGAVTGIVKAIWDKLPEDLRPKIAVYAAVAATMLWRAGARYGDQPTDDRKAGANGALFFIISDSLIGLTRFSEGDNRLVRYAIILLYWLGQVGIAESATERA